MVVGKLTLVAMMLLLAGCGSKDVSVPVLSITCPDLAGRATLGDGSTYRNLAASRAEAISGWRQCHDALSIAQG